ncbi:MAG: hypothetical protein KAF91_28685 [Nostoc sp. TH1S01]|nr:hypothetical protein [Nostoc sp. TH1S01]
MNICQAKGSKKAITFNLLPFHSSALGEIKDNRYLYSALCHNLPLYYEDFKLSGV